MSAHLDNEAFLPMNRVAFVYFLLWIDFFYPIPADVIAYIVCIKIHNWKIVIIAFISKFL